MLWQDYVISAAQIGFAVALIPTLKGKDKPAVSTSFMNTVLLLLVSFCELTLRLYFSAATLVITSAIWAILGIQKIKAVNHN